MRLQKRHTRRRRDLEKINEPRRNLSNRGESCYGNEVTRCRIVLAGDWSAGAEDFGERCVVEFSDLEGRGAGGVSWLEVFFGWGPPPEF